MTLAEIMPKISVIIVLSGFLKAVKTHAAMISIDVPPPTENTDIAKIVTNTLQWALSVARPIALFMLLAGGITYITAGGNENRVRTAKNIITWTILGLILVLVSFSLMVVLNRILT